MRARATSSTPPVGELFARRKIDEALYEELETALIAADCGVEASAGSLERFAALRQKKAEDGEAAQAGAARMRSPSCSQPLERTLEVRAPGPSSS